MYLYVATWQSKVTEYGRESCLDDYGKISVYRHVNGRTASTLCIQIFKRYFKRSISTTGILKAQLICACRPSCLSTSRACVAVGPALCCQWAWLMLLRDQDSMWLKRLTQHRAVPREEEDGGESITQGEKKGDDGTAGTCQTGALVLTGREYSLQLLKGWE